MYISDFFGHFIDELEYIVTVAGIAVLALTALILRANRQNFSTPIAFAAGGIVVRYDREVVAEGFQSIGQAHWSSKKSRAACAMPFTNFGCVCVAELASFASTHRLIFGVVENFFYCFRPDGMIARPLLATNLHTVPIEIPLVRGRLIPLDMDNRPPSPNRITMLQIGRTAYICAHNDQCTTRWNYSVKCCRSVPLDSTELLQEIMGGVAGALIYRIDLGVR